jgi:hypothetical protein
MNDVSLNNTQPQICTHLIFLNIPLTFLISLIVLCEQLRNEVWKFQDVKEVMNCIKLIPVLSRRKRTWKLCVFVSIRIRSFRSGQSSWWRSNKRADHCPSINPGLVSLRPSLSLPSPENSKMLTDWSFMLIRWMYVHMYVTGVISSSLQFPVHT